MAVFRVNKNKDYVTMGKYHFKEKNMSLKAKGLLSEMLSLPDDWDYSIKGLEQINKEGKDTIISILKELEEFGYLERTQLRDTRGTFTGYEYNVYEKPNTENPYTEKPNTENPPQLNNKELNTNKLNNKDYKENIKRKFIKPSIEEIQAYCKERNNRIDANKFFDFYETNGWVQGKNKPIRDWKACIRTWERRNKQDKPSDYERPSWLDEDIKKDDEEFYISDEDRKRFGI